MAASAPHLVRTAVVTLSVGQRGAHGLALRAAQGVKDAGGALDRAQLLVDRHRHRALAVRARSKELGVAWVVARVAPHRPAPRLVAEDAKARRVLPRARRIGGSPLEYLALARAGLEIEEITPYVAACECVEIRRGSDHAP